MLIETLTSYRLYIYIFAAVTAFAVAFLLTPLMKKLAIKTHFVDNPDTSRKFQKEAVPYLGGVAIIAAFIASTSILWFSSVETLRKYAIVVIGTILMMWLGLADDKQSIKPIWKFICEILICTATVLAGESIEFVSLFGKYINFGFMSIPITVIWMVLITNAVNMIDGLDGLAGGISAFSLISIIVSSLVMQDEFCFILSLMLCLSIAGFLPFNLAPAKIYMGDAGALSIGYIMACLSVFGLFKGQAFFSMIVPTLVFALPIADAIELFFERIIRGRKPFSSDRLHIHYKLIDAGFSTRQSVLILWALSLAFCAAGVLYIWYKGIAIAVAVTALIVTALIKFIPIKKTHNTEEIKLDAKEGGDNDKEA